MQQQEMQQTTSDSSLSITGDLANISSSASSLTNNDGNSDSLNGMCSLRLIEHLSLEERQSYGHKIIISNGPEHENRQTLNEGNLNFKHITRVVLKEIGIKYIILFLLIIGCLVTSAITLSQTTTKEMSEKPRFAEYRAPKDACSVECEGDSNFDLCVYRCKTKHSDQFSCGDRLEKSQRKHDERSSFEEITTPTTKPKPIYMAEMEAPLSEEHDKKPSFEEVTTAKSEMAAYTCTAECTEDTDLNLSVCPSKTEHREPAPDQDSLYKNSKQEVGKGGHQMGKTEL